MAKGMGLRLRLRLALAVGLRLRLEMVSPLSPNWARRSQKIATLRQQQSPFTLGRAECQRVASGGNGVGIDRLFNWLRCLPPPATSYLPRKQRRKWSDVDKAHPRQRRRLNCRTFYSRTYFKVCASASAPRRSYRSSCCLPAEVTIPLPLCRATVPGYRQSQHKILRAASKLKVYCILIQID